MLSRILEKRPRNIFYGWWLVAIVVFKMGVIVGPFLQSMGIFFVVLEKQFGWSRTALSIAFALGRIEGALFGPIEGWLTDHFGVRRMVLIGLLILGLGMIAFSLIDTIWEFYGAIMLVFLGSGLSGFIPMMALLNNWFSRRRATATGIGMSGGALGGLLVPAVAFLVATFGWRETVQGFGIAVLLVAFPLTRLIRNKPEDYSLLPDGDSPSDSEHPQSASGASNKSPRSVSDEDSFTLKQALRTQAFWAIAFTHGLGAAVMTTTSIHIVPALHDAGMSLSVAAMVVMIFTGTAALFRLFGGFLGDRYSKRPLIVIFNILQGIAMLIAATVRALPAAIVFAVIFGIGHGGRVPLLVTIRGDYFGRKNFATIFGVSQLPMNLVMMSTPVIAGYLFDTLGSYSVPFIGLAAMNFLGAGLMMAASRPSLPVSGVETRGEKAVA